MSLWLSRIVVAPTSAGAQRVLHDPYMTHQALLAAFPSKRDGGAGRLLFRVEPEVRNSKVTILVQSEVEPDWSKTAFQQLLPAAAGASKALDLAFPAGQKLRFRLRANPTVKRDGKRLGRLGDDQQQAWFERKLRAGGMRLEAAVLVDEGFVRGIKAAAAQPRTLTFLSVRADGVLAVVNPDQAVECVRVGIGSAKGFGFGLLSLGRA